MIRLAADLVQDFFDIVRYDVLNEHYEPVSYPAIKTKLDLEFTSNGVYAISQDVPGLIFSAEKLELLPDALLDAWLVYYDVPRHQARKVKENVSISFDNGLAVVSNRGENLNYA